MYPRKQPEAVASFDFRQEQIILNNCQLCPRKCGAVRTQTEGAGFCRLPGAMRIARIAPHLWEEPPISGTRGTGGIFFAGCTLRCVYCQNAAISHSNAGKPFTERELAESMRRLVDMGMQTISFITATPYTDAVLRALDIYRPPVPLVWNSSGYETVETLRRLKGAIDVYLPDMKHVSTSVSRLCAGVSDYFEVASAAIQEMVRQTGNPVYDAEGIMTRGTLIRHLILPGLTGESRKILNWINDSFGDRVPISLMSQYVPFNVENIPGLNRRITEREYQRVLECMEALELKGYVQDAESADAGFVPLFNQPESFV